MTRPFASLIALMLVSVAACVMVLEERQTTETAALGAGELFFPKLGSAAAGVATVDVHRADGQFTLSRTSDGWVNLGLGGYPAFDARMETAVAALAALFRVAPRTSRARLHPKLGVEKVAPGAESTRLVVMHGDGSILADIIVGANQRPGTGRRRAGVYVRSPGDATAWLADGSLDVHYDAADWSDRSLIDIKPTAVQSMTIVYGSGERIALGRGGSHMEELSLVTPPPGTTVRHRYQIKYLAGMFDGLRMSSARAASGNDGNNGSVVTVTSRSGVQVTLRQLINDSRGRKPDQLWATLTVEAAAGARLAAGEAANVARMRAAFSGWEFLLSRAVNERLKIRLTDIVGSDTDE